MRTQAHRVVDIVEHARALGSRDGDQQEAAREHVADHHTTSGSQETYYKTYPTFDVLGTQFAMARSKAHENRDCSKVTGFIQPVHDEVRRGFVDGLRLGLRATYPAPSVH